MVPSGSTTSTGYALVDATNDYLIYQPANASFTVNLSARIFGYEWTEPATGSITNTGSFTALAGNNTFTLPGGYATKVGCCILYPPRPRHTDTG